MVTVPKIPNRGGYALVICEKPDAAKRVADALARSTPETLDVGGVDAFLSVSSSGETYVVCAAVGHLYGVSDTIRNRRVYPVADLEWFPFPSIGRKGSFARRIRAIEALARRAASFVNACDLDVEGETIGYNILRYACGGKEGSALRARFSSLTREEVAMAFGEGALRPAGAGAAAGRLRHAVDFLWGVNLSRALSEAFRSSQGFRTISIGRVQGPTLNFAVQREVDVKTFVPTPYWKVQGRFNKDGTMIDAKYSGEVIETELAAMSIKESCDGRKGVVASVETRVSINPPPPPFNLADLQKEAFRSLGYTPSRTLQVAERLYLGAMISYPRTWSQRLPRLDYRKLLTKIAEMPEYSRAVREVLDKGVLRPREGRNTDQAHPAIYPTGEPPRRPLGSEEKAILDLVVKRLLSCFGENAAYDVRTVEICVGEHRFTIEQTTLSNPGWISLVPSSRPHEAAPRKLPELREGDLLPVDEVTVERHLRSHPPRFDQATLLEKMERERIGTKATRADVISTILERGYVSGRSLAPTELGLALVDAMEEYCPQILSTSLTRDVEAELERIEASGELEPEFFERTLGSLFAALADLRAHQVEVAGRIPEGASDAGSKTVLGRCPVCKEGKLWVVRSRKTGKRFVGCTGYPRTCSASAPLPQRGTLKPASKACNSCGWPVVYLRLGRRPWRLCVNERCPKKINVYAMRVPRGRKHSLHGGAKTSIEKS